LQRQQVEEMSRMQVGLELTEKHLPRMEKMHLRVEMTQLPLTEEIQPPRMEKMHQPLMEMQLPQMEKIQLPQMEMIQLPLMEKIQLPLMETNLQRVKTMELPLMVTQQVTKKRELLMEMHPLRGKMKQQLKSLQLMHQQQRKGRE